ncbi:hypothetical protein [Longimicrobium terrae]|uniref:Hsp70 family protein n=1 Tax=Longimicrobium terrae TaxID=1639882 RepID=A0A841H389_9BACT|nr:hypothetical protein [Longimicrobium terrae]MBB4638092.1 hypothetical protein [Longimicrobium terrae]MBB6072464.1 hypothetical protein [Longimicrobium terrae]NNC32125.1 hypothetical protein [Longimicrobium terrae]
MKNSRLVSIDLGSAYTKVAIRRNWNAESDLLRDLPLASDEVDFCVPSVVARVDEGGRTRWTIGAAAAAQTPGDGVRIFRYWKARLFATGPRAQVSRDQMGQTAEAEGGENYDEVATEFFRGLRQSLEHSPYGEDIAASAVRVCVPKIDVADMDARVGSILDAAGWRPAHGRVTVYEPESNACGMFTRGRNATWYPPAASFTPRAGRSLHLMKMLEPEGLLQALRRMSGSFGVLVIDIGGFTTDFGYVQFDTSFSSNDWHRPTIVQQSYELGIRELDQAIYDSLDEGAQREIRALSPSQWDALKVDLYGGAPVTLGNGQRIGAGEGAERTVEALRNFADRVIAVRDTFLRDHVRGPVNAQTLTGGGSMIAPLHRAVVQALATDEHARVYDLLDENEPRQTLVQRGGYVDEDAVAARARRNQELVRGGSAIGGSSVFFE